ncbi:toxin-antitoxin system, antitoxin component, PHD family [Lachnoanaerobaculum sp. ICM7]|nr:toxin-antitoxin system, antitoxin component, PHD family [Lachnoanaerobaculum sp. ICM7]
MTKNGGGRFVVMDIEDYERDHAEKKLLTKLQEAEEVVKDCEGWLNLDELKAMMEE